MQIPLRRRRSTRDQLILSVTESESWAFAGLSSDVQVLRTEGNILYSSDHVGP